MEAYTNDHARAVLTEFADLAPKRGAFESIRRRRSATEALAVGDVLTARG